MDGDCGGLSVAIASSTSVSSATPWTTKWRGASTASANSSVSINSLRSAVRRAWIFG